MTGPWPPAAIVAAALAGAAVWLCGPPRLPRSGRGGAVVPVVVAVVGLGSLAVLGGLGIPVLLAGVVALAAHRFSSRARARAAAVENAARVQQACEGMASALAAGLPVGVALDAAAEDWEPLAEAAASHRLGGSVPDALRSVSSLPGAGDLFLVAAAWQVAHRGGAGLAPALGSAAESLRRAQATRRVVRSELASARATARLLASLPLLTLGVGSGAGGSPVGFLLGSPGGHVCLAAGLALGLLGLGWIEAIAASVEAAG